MHPSTGGALKLYESVFKPLLKKHEKEIHEFIEKVKSGAGELQKEAMSAGKKMAEDAASPENMMKAAALANEA